MNYLLKVRLKEILESKPDYTQKRLAQETGIQPTTIAEIANNMRTTFNRSHLTKIAKALQITDMNELFTLDEDE